jgi:tol-pal system protein YbgF
MAGAVHAQSKSDDPVEKHFRDIEKQLKQLREIVLQARDTGQPVSVRLNSDPDPALEGVQQRIDDLEQAARTRNEQIDTLTHDLELARHDAADAQAQAKSLTERMDRIEARLRALEGGTGAAASTAQGAPPAPLPGPGPAPGPGPGPDASAGPPPPPEADAGASFQRAKQLLLQGQYASASGAFQNFVENYGDSPYGPEARYWLGETLFIRGLYADAATAYIGAVRGWPQTPWAPDAVVKLARTLIALNKAPDACRTLGEFGRRYPSAPAPAKARASEARAAAKCS